jgi:hypothetical protein
LEVGESLTKVAEDYSMIYQMWHVKETELVQFTAKSVISNRHLKHFLRRIVKKIKGKRLSMLVLIRLGSNSIPFL